MICEYRWPPTATSATPSQSKPQPQHYRVGAKLSACAAAKILSSVPGRMRKNTANPSITRFFKPIYSVALGCVYFKLLSL